MLNLSKIRELCKEKQITLKELSEQINFSETGLHYALKRNKISTENLIEIANYFHVSVAYFCEQPGIINVNDNKFNEQSSFEMELLKKENEGLKNELQAKNELIELLKKMIP